MASTFFLPSPSQSHPRSAPRLAPFSVRSALNPQPPIKKTSQKATVVEEDIYNIDTGPELSTKEVSTPEHTNKQTNKQKKPCFLLPYPCICYFCSLEEIHFIHIYACHVKGLHFDVVLPNVLILEFLGILV